MHLFAHTIQGRPNQSTDRWAGAVSAVNALVDSKHFPFSLRKGTKEEKRQLDKVLHLTSSEERILHSRTHTDVQVQLPLSRWLSAARLLAARSDSRW